MGNISAPAEIFFMGKNLAFLTNSGIIILSKNKKEFSPWI
jgi:hypothetical protein